MPPPQPPTRGEVPPFLGWSALPGGYIRNTETLDQAARRELKEETGVDGHQLHLEQLGAYGAPGRDPRGRIVTVAHLALGPDLPAPMAGTDAKPAHGASVEAALADPANPAFDHSVILRDALERSRTQLECTTAATAFCAEPFSVSELRRGYEVVWGLPLDPSNFRRKVTRSEGFLEPTGERRILETGRPAALSLPRSIECLWCHQGPLLYPRNSRIRALDSRGVGTRG